VRATLDDYGAFEWGAYTFRVLPAPGHTRGSIVLLVEVDGQTVAFTGDLLASPGRAWQPYALQWSYGGGVGEADGVQTAAITLRALLAESPARLFPSHGQIIDAPEQAIGELMGRLRDFARYLEANANTSTWLRAPVGLVADRHLVQLSDHLWMNQFSIANSYFLVADNGDGLFMDYGYPTFHHFLGGFRFAEHSIQELAERAGLRRVDLFIPSHYHDDHIAGVPFLQRRYGTRVWAHSVMADVLQRPSAYSLPCLLPEPLHLERSLREGETFEWSGLRFEIFHAPGHTYYHCALCMQVDGLRVALTGDTFHASVAGPMLGGPIFRNRFAPGDFQRTIELLREWEPDLLLTGHSGAAEVDRAWLDLAWRRAQEMDERVCALAPVPEEVGFALDPHWVTIYPYQSNAPPGSEVDVTVRLRNHAGSTVARVELAVPHDWTVEPGRATVELPARQEAEARFSIGVPADWTQPGPAVVCADVSLDDGTRLRRFGQVAECLLYPAGERAL
jgi:glyoxylase-like metal-dependent hydrolase (beta-lactamase superfamily II)